MVETNADLLQSPASRQQILRPDVFGFEHYSHEAVLKVVRPPFQSSEKVPRLSRGEKEALLGRSGGAAPIELGQRGTKW